MKRNQQPAIRVPTAGREELATEWDESARISLSGSPSSETRNRRIFGLSRTLISSALPERSATTRLPDRIFRASPPAEG